MMMMMIIMMMIIIIIICPAKIACLKLSRKFPVGMRTPPLKTKIMLGHGPWTNNDTKKSNNHHNHTHTSNNTGSNSNTNTVSFHNFKSQNFKLSVSNPKSKCVVYSSVLSQISDCQGLGRKNKHEILKINRKLGLVICRIACWSRVSCAQGA